MVIHVLTSNCPNHHHHRWASTTSPQLSSLAAIWPRCSEQSACSLTPLPSPRPGPGLTISLTSCMLRGPLSTGMLERVWRKGSSQRQERTLLLWRRITRRSALTPLRVEQRTKAMSTSPQEPSSQGSVMTNVGHVLNMKYTDSRSLCLNAASHFSRTSLPLSRHLCQN